MCRSSRIIFALCVALQVGSPFGSSRAPHPEGARRAGGTAACRPGADGHIQEPALGHRMRPGQQRGASGSFCRAAVGARAGACEWVWGVVLAGAVQRCRHRILLMRRCVRAAAGRRVVARPLSTGGGWRRARGARQYPRPRRSGAPSRLGSWCSPGPVRDTDFCGCAGERSAERQDIGLSGSVKERPSSGLASWAEGQCQPSQDDRRHAHRRRAGPRRR